MTVSRYLSFVRERFGVVVTRRGIRVPATMPTDAKVALAGYRTQIDKYLATGEDRALSMTAMAGDIEALGLVQIGERWTHPQFGDEFADEILLGLFPQETARQWFTERLAKVRRLFGSPLYARD